MIKKFYEAAAEGQTSMPTAEATQQQAQPPQPLSVAAMMAKEGKIADTSTVRNYEPVVIKPGDEKPPTTEPPATEPVAAEPKVEEKSDSPTPPTEPVNPPIATEEPVKTVTWQEQLKTAQVQPDEVLKEIGFAPETIGFVKELKDGLDPKMVAFFNVWKSGGDVAGYLKEMTVDYGKMNSKLVDQLQTIKEKYGDIKVAVAPNLDGRFTSILAADVWDVRPPNSDMLTKDRTPVVVLAITGDIVYHM